MAHGARRRPSGAKGRCRVVVDPEIAIASAGTSSTTDERDRASSCESSETRGRRHGGLGDRQGSENEAGRRLDIADDVETRRGVVAGIVSDVETRREVVGRIVGDVEARRRVVVGPSRMPNRHDSGYGDDLRRRPNVHTRVPLARSERRQRGVTTRVGTLRVPTAESIPSWPSLLFPKHHGASSRMKHVWSAADASSETPAPSVTAVTIGCVPTVVVPSCPPLFDPQQPIAPVERRAQVWLEPAETRVAFASPSTARGRFSVSDEILFPN